MMEEKTMKKTYICPESDFISVNLKAQLLSGSGVATGGSVGNEYVSGDVTYSRENFSVWSNEE